MEVGFFAVGESCPKLTKHFFRPHCVDGRLSLIWGTTVTRGVCFEVQPDMAVSCYVRRNGPNGRRGPDASGLSRHIVSHMIFGMAPLKGVCQCKVCTGGFIMTQASICIYFLRF
jgi:hypothetical protein